MRRILLFIIDGLVPASIGALLKNAQTQMIHPPILFPGRKLDLVDPYSLHDPFPELGRLDDIILPSKAKLTKAQKRKRLKRSTIPGLGQNKRVLTEQQQYRKR